MYWWILGGTLATLFVWFWRWGSAPYPNPLTEPDSLARALRWVLLRGVHKGGIRGSLRVYLREAESTQLVFRKHQLSDGQYGLRAVFTQSKTSPAYFDRLRVELERRGVAHTELIADGVPGLVVEIGQDYGLALVVAQTLFQDVAGASLARDCLATMHDVIVSNHPSLTGTDAPNEQVWR
jgi:hypothetical protein